MPSDLDAAPLALSGRTPLRVGDVLGERYRLVRHVATGGMGQVWAADDIILHRQVAVKVLRDDFSGRPEFLERFEHEARHAASVTHPHIATLHDYVRDDSLRPPRAFLVMELVNGEPLSALLRRTPVPRLGTTVRVLAQSAHALAAAHRNGVVHRDVKPANILLDEDQQVKLTDFGIAGPVDAAAASTRAEVLGTPHYMSPEQARGLPVTPSSDLYSLGVVAYEMLSGRRPFEGSSTEALIGAHLHQLPPPLPDDVPAHIRGVVLSALAKRPEDRPIDAAAFARVVRSRTIPHADDEPTALLPVDQAPTLVLATAAPLDATPNDAPHRRVRGALFWTATAAVAIAAVALSLDAAGDGSDQVIPVETTVPVATTAVVSVPSSPTQANSNTSGDNDQPGKGNGKSKGKGNDD